MHSVPTPFQIHSLWSFALFVFFVFTPHDSQIAILSLYAKNSRKGSQQLEYLRVIRHFSSPNLNIFKEYRISLAKMMRIFQQIRTFYPSNPSPNLLFPTPSFNISRQHPLPKSVPVCVRRGHSRPSLFAFRFQQSHE